MANFKLEAKINALLFGVPLIIGFFVALFLPHLIHRIDHSQAVVNMSQVPAEILKQCLDPYGRLADIADDWNPSDVYLAGDIKPRSRLHSICRGRNSWILVCDLGGFTVQRIEVAATLKEDGKSWDIVRENIARADIVKCR